MLYQVIFSIDGIAVLSCIDLFTLWESCEQYVYRKWPFQIISRLSILNLPIQGLNVQEEDSVVNKQTRRSCPTHFSPDTLSLLNSLGKLRFFLTRKLFSAGIFEMQLILAVLVWVAFASAAPSDKNEGMNCLIKTWVTCESAVTLVCSLVICQPTRRRLEELKESMKYSGTPLLRISRDWQFFFYY